MHTYNNILQKNNNTFKIIIVKILFFFSPDEGCYKLVEAKTLTSTSKNAKHLPSDETIDG